MERIGARNRQVPQLADKDEKQRVDRFHIDDNEGKAGNRDLCPGPDPERLSCQ